LQLRAAGGRQKARGEGHRPRGGREHARHRARARGEGKGGDAGGSGRRHQNGQRRAHTPIQKRKFKKKKKKNRKKKNTNQKKKKKTKLPQNPPTKKKKNQKHKQKNEKNKKYTHILTPKKSGGGGIDPLGDVASGKKITEGSEHGSSLAFKFSPDGKYVSCAGKGLITRRASGTGHRQRSFLARSSTKLWVSMHNNQSGRRGLFTISLTILLEVWDTRSTRRGLPRRRFPRIDIFFNHLSFDVPRRDWRRVRFLPVPTTDNRIVISVL